MILYQQQALCFFGIKYNNSFMQKRVKREAQDFASCPLPNMHIMSPFYREDKSIKQKWLLLGPDQSSYSQRAFLVQVNFPSDYPFRPPKIKFITKIFHPSIYPEGHLACCSFSEYRDGWSPALSTAILLSKVIEMMQFPKRYMSKRCGNREAIILIVQDEPSFCLKAKEQANKNGIDALLDY